jgi:hypothetical protein
MTGCSMVNKMNSQGEVVPFINKFHLQNDSVDFSEM